AKKTVLEETSAHDQLAIKFVIDMETNRFNETVTEYGTFKIAGHNLKIAGTDPSVGIEFLSLEDLDCVYRVESRHIAVNNPSELVFTAPWMVLGEEVEVRVTTQFTAGGKPLKKPRSVTFDKALTVLMNDFVAKPKDDEGRTQG
ncbi:MAG: DUF4469 domain-containing protein, partial [Dysgonamonadaceae bacterium]|nr:DUF4469 domain-containing protein [Dysgonamonadaceae bacterium]